MSEPLINPVVDILTAEDTAPTWLIPDFLLQGTLMCWAGEQGTGKSAVLYALGLAVASGFPILGGVVPTSAPKRVLYFDQENSPQDRDAYLRRAWLGLHRNGVGPDLGLLMENFWPMHFQLGDDSWKDTAAFAVEQIQPHMIMFDTATPCFDIENENDNGEAHRIINGIRDLMRMCDPVATAIVLRHAKTRTTKGRRQMRGAKAWGGATDGTLFQVMGTGRPARDGLRITRIEPDKVRAYGLQQTIYINPHWTDDDRTGLVLVGSYHADKAHIEAEKEEERALEKAAD